MQDKGNTRSDKFEEFYRGAVDAANWLFWNCYRIGVTTLVIYCVTMLAGLLTADPDTATFRDFLIALRNPQIWLSSVMLAIVWVGLTLILLPSRRYPLAKGVMAQAQASRPRPNDPE